MHLCFLHLVCVTNCREIWTVTKRFPQSMMYKATCKGTTFMFSESWTLLIWRREFIPNEEFQIQHTVVCATRRFRVMPLSSLISYFYFLSITINTIFFLAPIDHWKKRLVTVWFPNKRISFRSSLISLTTEKIFKTKVVNSLESSYSHLKEKTDQFHYLSNCTPIPDPTLTKLCHQLTVIGLGGGRVGVPLLNVRLAVL